MSDPDQEPTETPTTDTEEAETAGKRMFRNWVGIAVVSILALLVLALAMMQATGLVDVFAPIADSGAQQWGIIAVFALLVLAAAGWSWSAIVG